MGRQGLALWVALVPSALRFKKGGFSVVTVCYTETCDYLNEQHMSDSAVSAPESDIPLFDIWVKLPPNADLDDIEHRGREFAGIREDHLATLLQGLRKSPQAKIGSAVSRERADKAKTQFSKAGLLVEVAPLLTIQTKMVGAFDGRYFCPACQNSVELPDNRQCPSCGIFVDKVDEDFLLKRRLREQERNKIEAQMTRDTKITDKRNRELREASIREQIRKELEEEYGLNKKAGVFSGKKGLVRGAVALAVLGVAFTGGQYFQTQRGQSEANSAANAAVAAKDTAAAHVDKMLDQVGPKETGASAAAPTGDPDIDDPLIQAAGGKRIGAEGITMEQAVAAAQVLGKSIGNTAGQNAPRPGVGGGAGGGVAGADKAGASASSSAGAATDTAAPIAEQTKLVLTAEFAQQLAELGQPLRAHEVLKALKASPKLAAEPGAALAVRRADLAIQAWAMPSQTEGRARSEMERIKASAMALADAGERTQTLARIGVILSRHPQLPPEAARAFLTLAAESLKTMPSSPQRVTVLNDWVVSLGEVLLAEVSARSRAGDWSKARAAGVQLEALIKQATEPSAVARLQAVNYQVQLTLGQPAKANQSLTVATTLASTISSPLARASVLRAITRLSRAPIDDKLQSTIAALSSQLDPRSGLEKAQALAQLSLLFSDAGRRDQSNQFSQSVHATAGLSPQDSAAVKADLLTRGDLSQAKALHQAGLYAESEVVLQRLGRYLL